MRTNILKIAFIGVFCFATLYNIIVSKSKNTVSDLVLDNVEALAYEWGGTNCFWLNSGNWFDCIPWGSGLGCPCGM